MGLQNSQIIICKNIRLDKSYKDVLSYSESQMLTLCQQNAVASASNYSFIRGERGYIKTSFSYNDALKCNYMAFQNTDYSNKWFFAFIDDVIYDNDGTARIRYTVDEFSTWYDYWDAEPCFIVREHVSDDTIGLHTIPEGLEYGEYVIAATGQIASSLNDTPLICIGVSYLPNNTPFMTDNRMYGGVYSGMYYMLFRSTESAAKFVKAMADIGHANDLICVFMIPLSLANVDYQDGWTQANLGNQTNIFFKVLPNTPNIQGTDDFVIPLASNISVPTPSTLDGYTPKNNKLYCWPYNCLSITNNAGMQAEFRYEDFISNNPLFSVIGIPTPSGSGWIYPVNYKKNSDNKSGYNWGIPLAKFPQGSCNADMYTNWMTQNGINLFGHRIDSPTSHAIMGSLQTITAAATGQFADIGTGLGNMFGAVQEQYRATMIPNQIVGQTANGDVTFAFNKMAPTYYKMTIKSEYAAVIDDWFNRFGYKINRVKIPNQIGRRYWNYIQIGTSENIGYSPSSASRSVPASSMEIINTIYRNGTTIWHNHANIGNYSLNNTIV